MDLCDIQQIKALLSRHGFHFSKSMGQNFLVEDWVPRDLSLIHILAVNRLRAKLADAPIRTVYGLGYQLSLIHI